jgi:hypothetical protein
MTLISKDTQIVKPDYISKQMMKEISQSSNPDSYDDLKIKYAKLEAVYIQHVRQLLQENLILKTKLQVYYDTFGKIEKLPDSYRKPATPYTHSNL